MFHTSFSSLFFFPPQLSFARPSRARWRWKAWRCVLLWPASGTAAPAAARTRPPSSTSCGTDTTCRCLATTPPLSPTRNPSERTPRRTEEEEQLEEEEREQENGGTDIFYPPKLQTCKNPQGLASIFNSGKVLLLCQPLLSGTPPPLCSSLLIDRTGQARHSTNLHYIHLHLGANSRVNVDFGVGVGRVLVKSNMRQEMGSYLKKKGFFFLFVL